MRREESIEWRIGQTSRVALDPGPLAAEKTLCSRDHRKGGCRKNADYPTPGLQRRARRILLNSRRSQIS